MLTDNFVTMEIGKAKHIALVAHDGKKKELIEWCDRNKEVLQGHFLCGTGTTARLIAEKTGLPVKGYCSGPLGGDQQIGAKIVEGQIDFMIFLWDPLEAQPHDCLLYTSDAADEEDSVDLGGSRIHKKKRKKN